MCGIAGIIRRHHQPVPAELLRKMAERLSHRGPDDQGLYSDQGLGLVQTRLSIIDLSGGHQPLLSADGNLVLVANGEIYNFIELRAELEACGHTFLTHSDSETVLYAYAEYGLDFARHLHGMFAFALYDKARNLLLLGRDRLGIKPLFWQCQGDRFTFASEIKAILAVLEGEAEVDADALNQYLQSQFNSGAETIIKGIERIRPGEVMVIHLDDLAIDRHNYWSPLEIEIHERSYTQASEEFEPLMATVMREHLRSDVPYGLFLSGGVDSAVLLALLVESQGQNIRTFSVGFSDQASDELADATYIANHFGAIHTPLILDSQTIFSRLPLSIWAADDLLRDYACLPTSCLAERASQEVKVVFTGEGGDEIFAGYGRYRRTALQRFVSNFMAPGSGGFRTRGQLASAHSRRLFGPELRASRENFRKPFIAAWGATPRAWSDLLRSQYVDLATALPDNLLVKADRMLMAFGVEGRVPFLDHRIVEFGLSLPDRLKVSSRTGKVFFKEWAEKRIPRQHLYRKKRGFHVPVERWLTDSFVRQLVDELEMSAGIRRWFDVRAVKNACRDHLHTHRYAKEIWSLMEFAIWHRLFIEGRSEKPSPQIDPLTFLAGTRG